MQVQRRKGSKRRAGERSRPAWQERSGSATESDASSDCGCSSSEAEDALLWRPGRGWDERRRDPRVNGADIYVARVTKSGMGNAKPCWRCLEWCRWAGVKRVFHWDGAAGRFEVVKVNGAGRENYETKADIRLFAGLVREHLPAMRLDRTNFFVTWY